MKNNDFFKLNMNKETKRAVMVLSIIALLILIIGLVSCSMQLSQKDNPSQIVVETDDVTPIPSDNPIVTEIEHEDTDVGDDTDNATADKDSDHSNGGFSKDTQDKKPTKPTEKLTKNPTSTPMPTATPSPTPTPKPTDPPINPTEPVKPTDPTTPPIKPEQPDKPDKPSGGGSSGSGGSVSYPAAVVEIVAPEFSHTDTEFEVKTVLRSVKSLEWSVTEDGKNIPQSELLIGTLDKDGGKITITQPGNYLLTATAQNYGNHTYIFSKKIIIHPTFKISVEADKTVHTDKTFTVKTTLSDNVTQQLNWHIFKDGKEIKWQDTVTGTLTNAGGSIQIKEKGSYTIKATAFDETSREFSGKADITVYPVIEIEVQAPNTAHTDTPITVAVNTKELGDLSLDWTATKEGKEIPLSDCFVGTLTDAGGSVRFLEKGSYKLTATAIDKAGRFFTAKAEITVYPVAAFDFTLPATTHTDKTIDILVKSSDLQDMIAEWTVIKDGKIVKATAVIEGTLNNDGGSIRFTQKGTYTLKAALTDATGRMYSHEATTVVYPVAEAGFYLPTMTHTDTTVEVKTSFKETQDLHAVWSLTKDGKAISLADGFEGILTDDGGNIQFRTVGSYELKATVTDNTGRSFTYTASTKVYPVITVSLELPKQTHTDRPVTAESKLTNAGALPVVWSMTKNDVIVAPENDLTNVGGLISFTEKGDYTVTAAVTDEAGRTFSVSKSIKVYPIPNIAFSVPSAVHTDDQVSINTTLTDMEQLTAVWYVDNTYGFQDWDTYIDGKLTNNGGSIRFTRAGVYDLQARVTDATGRLFRFNSGKIEVLPVLQLSFVLPETGYTDTQIDVRTRGNIGVLPIEWTLMKNGTAIPLEQAVSGTLNAQGGKIRFTESGEYRLTATMFDALGRVFTHTEKISIYPLYNCNFTMPQVARTGQNFVVNMSSTVNLNDNNVVWTAIKDGQNIAVSEYFKGTLGNSGGTVHVDVSGNYTLTATITDKLGRVFTATQSISVVNTAPTKPTITANVTRTAKDGRFLVNFTVNSIDPDGDVITYEYEGKISDNYYAVGTHIVKVRAKDNYGGISDWSQVTFTVANSAPTRPVITRTPNGNSVAPGTPVTITASSTDPDGDAVTYVWEGRPTETAVYALGKHTVRVKAVDSTGAESPWAAIVFFVMDSNGSGGMMLTGPDSTIMENGIDGATITQYTFTVPPVSGHSGQDYGRVRGYNIKTGAWDQLDYGTTSNGISFTRTLTAGTYSKLEMYYYTNHSCMYNKSNITYTVEYYFE
ncbi:S-layer homology domain-containing protein [Sinanaerobacter sp. ZZT-01]|uniref:S-layer homology domain-containing protein n=1 Tax=Sinanaerobacter sp. ZZT-01 TaxID=3111540 RepID=UPI002D796591|nr:S-layer homology domain-containing protein [Sinanaerobacter sp. ZZT-01]WRR93946.1 S-layer homology domain-containing protein [Sinanaerobacter sp. ZZT-01]